MDSHKLSAAVVVRLWAPNNRSNRHRALSAAAFNIVYNEQLTDEEMLVFTWECVPVCTPTPTSIYILCYYSALCDNIRPKQTN